MWRTAARPGAHARDGMTSEQAQQILDELKAIHKSVEARPVRRAGSPRRRRPDDKVSMALPDRRLLGRQGECTAGAGRVHRLPVPVLPAVPQHVVSRRSRRTTSTPARSASSAATSRSTSTRTRRGATAARCAAEQGKFWELRHTMIVNASQLQADKIDGLRGQRVDGRAQVPGVRRRRTSSRPRSTRTSPKALRPASTERRRSCSVVSRTAS